ncbi:hypothetical protein ACP70R_006515 [Stipagrostis hirtigluma subsp. patula]
MNTSTMPVARCAGKINNAAVFGRRRMVVAAAVSARASVCSAKKNDYYKVLSLEHSAAVGAEEIKRAYRRLALRYHPDVCPLSRRAESTELFLELRRAYETLSDPVRKVRYDAELSTTPWEATPVRQGDAFARDVWEAQLRVLRARSEKRQRARNAGARRSD